MFGCLFWFGVVGGRPQYPGFLSRPRELGGVMKGKVGTVVVCEGA